MPVIYKILNLPSLLMHSFFVVFLICPALIIPTHYTLAPL